MSDEGGVGLAVEEEGRACGTEVVDDHDEVGGKVLALLGHFLQRMEGVFCVEVEDLANGVRRVSVPQVPAFGEGGDEVESEGGFSYLRWANHEGEAAWHEPWVDEVVLDRWKRRWGQEINDVEHTDLGSRL